MFDRREERSHVVWRRTTLLPAVSSKCSLHTKQHKQIRNLLVAGNPAMPSRQSKCNRQTPSSHGCKMQLQNNGHPVAKRPNSHLWTASALLWREPERRKRRHDVILRMTFLCICAIPHDREVQICVCIRVEIRRRVASYRVPRRRCARQLSFVFEGDFLYLGEAAVVRFVIIEGRYRRKCFVKLRVILLLVSVGTQQFGVCVIKLYYPCCD